MMCWKKKDWETALHLSGLCEKMIFLFFDGEEQCFVFYVKLYQKFCSSTEYWITHWSVWVTMKLVMPLTLQHFVGFLSGFRQIKQ